MRRLLRAALAVLVLCAVAAGGWAYLLVERPYKGYADDEAFVEIVPGNNPHTMGRALSEAGVVPNATAFRLAVWLQGAGRRLQAGEYRFDAPMTPRAVVDKIVRGDVFLRPVTFREGLTIRQMAEVFEERGFGTQKEFIAAAAKADPVQEIRSDRRTTSRVTSFPTPTRFRAARQRTISWCA